MRAGYQDVSVERNETGIVVRARLQNRSRSVWDAKASLALSYQIYDGDRETLLIEGPRQPLPRNVARGEQVCVESDIPIPAEDGRYQLFVSLIDEERGWSFEKGSPFLLVDFRRKEGSEVLRHSVTTMSAVRWRRFGRTIGRAFTYPVRTLLRHQSLIVSMVRRDIAGRYAGSHAGAFWTIIHPLLMMLTYWFVFGFVLRTRFGDDGRPSNFVLYFLAGMLPWLAFSEAVGRAPNDVVEHANFVKKLVFPLEILPVNLVFAGLFSELFGLLIFFGGMLGFGRAPDWSALYLPLLLLPQLFLTLGLTWFLAALGALFRDLGQIIGFLLTVWFFITPICYPTPANMLWLFEKNPIYILVDGYRRVLLEGRGPDWAAFLPLTFASAAFFVFGHAWFYKLKKQFADLV